MNTRWHTQRVAWRLMDLEHEPSPYRDLDWWFSRLVPEVTSAYHGA